MFSIDEETAGAGRPCYVGMTRWWGRRRPHQRTERDGMEL